MSELREVLAELWADRRRMRLVVVALAWGTLGLTVLLGFGNGMDDAMRGVLRRSGDSLLRISDGATSLPFGGVPAGRPVPVTAEDARALRRVEGVSRVSVEYAMRVRVRVDGRDGASTPVRGVDDGFAAVRGLTVRPGGRFVSPIDVEQRRRTAVLGDRVARRLFGDADPVGRTIGLSGQPFLVIGRIARRNVVMNYGGEDDDKIWAPATTLRTLFGLRDPTWLVVEAEHPEHSAALAAEVRRLLAARHRFDPADRGAVSIVDQAAQIRRIGATVTGTRLFMLVVGVLGLLVAAIGVANVMFALVEERVREIGLRLALGARPAQVRARQLVEVLAIVAVGGGGGLLLATLVLWGIDAIPFGDAVKAYLGSPVPSPLVALSVAALLGGCALVAGWQPAARAAAVEPVEALRHE